MSSSLWALDLVLHKEQASTFRSATNSIAEGSGSEAASGLSRCDLSGL